MATLVDRVVTTTEHQRVSAIGAAPLPSVRPIYFKDSTRRQEQTKNAETKGPTDLTGPSSSSSSSKRGSELIL